MNFACGINTQKEVHMIRDRIIRAAVTLYSRYGIKSVTMDNICEVLGISKATIYKEFESKEVLLKECFVREVSKISSIVDYVEARSLTGLEVIWFSCKILHDCYASYCQAFKRDILKYPETKSYWDDYIGTLTAKCANNLRKGVLEGDFLSGNEYELVALMFTEQVWKLNPEYQLPMIISVLRGFCTIAGSENLDRIINMDQDFNKTYNISNRL